MVISPERQWVVINQNHTCYKDDNGTEHPTKLYHLKCPHWWEINKIMPKILNLQRSLVGDFWKFSKRPFDCCPHTVTIREHIELICNRRCLWMVARCGPFDPCDPIDIVQTCHATCTLSLSHSSSHRGESFERLGQPLALTPRSKRWSVSACSARRSVPACSKK